MATRARAKFFSTRSRRSSKGSSASKDRSLAPLLLKCNENDDALLLLRSLSEGAVGAKGERDRAQQHETG